MIGEHVAMVKKDSNGQITWVLGIVESVTDSEQCRVAHMVSKDQIKWTFPKKANIEEVNNSDIICSNLAVKYCQTANICCTIEKKLKEKLNMEVVSLTG